MKVLFIRHGSAEDRSDDKPDAERQLTCKGSQLLYEQASYLIDFLANKDVYFISSPLVRARQTAEVFTNCGLKQFQLKDYVALGNFESLKIDIANHNGEIMVVVGHSPTLEEWTYGLTGQWVKLKKGSVVALEIRDSASNTGQILWRYDLKNYSELTKLTKKQDSKVNFREDIEALIRSYIALIKAQRALYLEKPNETESVHKLRIRIRQFRSLISFLKPLIHKNQQKEFQKNLKNLAQACAFLRELDVLIEQWQKYQQDFLQRGMTGQEFLRILKMERDLEAKRLVRLLEKPLYIESLGQLEASLLNAIDLNGSPFKNLDEMVKLTLEKWHDEIKEEYAAISENDLKVIHALRIRAKKARYVMEIFEMKEDAEGKKIHQDIKNWQDVLGNITDAKRNPQAASEIAARYSNSLIKEEIDLFSELENYRADGLYQEFFVQSD